MPHDKVIGFHVNTITDPILKDKDAFPETTYECLVPCTFTANVKTGFDGKINCSFASKLKIRFSNGRYHWCGQTNRQEEGRKKENKDESAVGCCFSHDPLQMLSTKE